MDEQVIVDAGPLVAILRQDDQHHQVCREVTQIIKPPLVTTWLAVTEAAWLLRRVPFGVSSLIGMIECGLVHCAELDAAFPPWLRKFLAQYADLSPQIADASLVYIADRYRTNLVFTLDRRDFVVLRNSRGQEFRLLPQSL